MQLTKEEIDKLNKLPKEKILAIMNECKEILGCISVQEYCDANDISRRTVHLHISQNKIKYFEIGNHKLPLINF